MRTGNWNPFSPSLFYLPLSKINPLWKSKENRFKYFKVSLWRWKTKNCSKQTILTSTIEFLKATERFKTSLFNKANNRMVPLTHCYFEQLLKTSLSVYIYFVTCCGCFSQLSLLVLLYFLHFQYFYYYSNMLNLITVFAVKYWLKFVCFYHFYFHYFFNVCVYVFLSQL